MNRVKLAVSLPISVREVEELEEDQKQTLDAIRVWKAVKDEERLTKSSRKGIEGFRKLQDLEGWEKASLNTFSEGEW